MQGQCNASKPMPAPKMSRVRRGMHEEPPLQNPLQSKVYPYNLSQNRQFTATYLAIDLICQSTGPPNGDYDPARQWEDLVVGVAKLGGWPRWQGPGLVLQEHPFGGGLPHCRPVQIDASWFMLKHWFMCPIIMHLFGYSQNVELIGISSTLLQFMELIRL